MQRITQSALFQLNRKILFSSAIILLSLALYIYFPISGTAQELTKGIFFLILMPFLFIRIILKEKMSDYGLSLKEKSLDFLWSVLALGVNLIIFYLLINHSTFGTNYALPSSVTSSFWFFLLYELIFVNLTIFIQEYFFRGFVLFSFQKKFGPLAIIIQLFLLVVLFFLAKSLTWQMLPFIILAISGGVISYKNKSFIHSYFIGISAIIILDAYLISQIK